MNRIWIYQSKKALTDGTLEEITSQLNEFIDRWSAHKMKLDARFEILHNQFIILYVNQDEIMASGCSIDDSVRFLQALDQKFNLSLFDRQQMAFLDPDGEVRVCSLNEISELRKSGLIQDETSVFNNTIMDENQLSTSWKIPFKLSGYSAFA